MYKLLFTTALLVLLCGCSCQKEKNTSSLQNTDWRLKELVEGSVTESIPADVVITATFEGEKVTGKGGCNAYSATYTTTGNQISIVILSATKTYCLRTGALETRYFRALEAGQSWEISGNTLTVQSANGSLIFEAL